MPRKRKPASETENTFPAKRIRLLLDSKEDMKYEDYAQLWGVSRQTIGYYAQGVTMPSFEMLGKIADYFNTTVDYLLGRTEVRSPSVEIQQISELTGLEERTIDTLMLYQKAFPKMSATANVPGMPPCNVVSVLNSMIADSSHLPNALMCIVNVVRSVNKGLTEEQLAAIQERTKDRAIGEYTLWPATYEMLMKANAQQALAELVDFQIRRYTTGVNPDGGSNEN